MSPASIPASGRGAQCTALRFRHGGTIRVDESKGAIPITEEQEPPLTVEEIRAFLDMEPLTGAEIVKRGLVGGWEDMGIEDGATWVRDMRDNLLDDLKWPRHSSTLM